MYCSVSNGLRGTSFGGGTLIATNGDTLPEDARTPLAHGSRRKYYKKYYNETLCYSSRLNEVQAAVLRVKSRHVESANARRREGASCYDRLLTQGGGQFPHTMPLTECTFTTSTRSG